MLINSIVSTQHFKGMQGPGTSGST